MSIDAENFTMYPLPWNTFWVVLLVSKRLPKMLSKPPKFVLSMSKSHHVAPEIYKTAPRAFKLPPRKGRKKKHKHNTVSTE